MHHVSVLTQVQVQSVMSVFFQHLRCLINESTAMPKLDATACSHRTSAVLALSADEVRNFVADLAHLAYSRGLPGGPAGSAPMAQPDGMGTGLQPQAALMQQAMMNVPVPVHMIPGHPSFDQHAYNLLMQQQQQHQEQQLQHQQQQEQYEAHQQHQHVEVQTADAHGDVKRISEAQHALPASELSQDAARQGHRIEHPLPTSGGET